MTHIRDNYTRIKAILLLPLFVTMLYLPVILNPNILFNRDNDLVEFFWPIYYFTRNQILFNHQLPLWNTLFFSGTPLLPDPQSPLFYIPNIVFLLFKNIDLGFFLLFFIHSIWGGIGTYFLAKKGLGLKNNVSIFVSLIYVTTPKVAGYLEAGHIGLVTSFAWLPFATLGMIYLSRKFSFKNVLLVGVSLGALFYTHILVFAISTFSLIVFYYYLLLVNKKRIIKHTFYLGIAFTIVLIFTFITLLAQLNWQKETTRNLLLSYPDVYPKWTGMKEFLKAVIAPEIFGTNFMNQLDTEKWIPIGFFITLLSFIGFMKLKINLRIILFTLFLTITLIALNNISPIYNLLIKDNWYILLRVSTRIWIIPIFISIFLSGFGLEYLLKLKRKTLGIFIATITVFELVFLFWVRLNKPIITNTNLAPKEIYEFLATDKDIFRVFCLNRCLSQKESAIYNLELADGYGTLQQTNYYTYSQQLSQSFYRNKYSLSIPPFEIYLFEKLQPIASTLSDYRIKYVISDHNLEDKNFILIKKVDKYSIYKNSLYKNPNYLVYTPNFIRVDVSKEKNKEMVIPEVYSSNWSAYLNGSEKIQITETKEGLRKVMLKKDTKFVDFKYQLFDL